jgi:4'-phosphopantetheinyl transferase
MTKDDSAKAVLWLLDARMAEKNERSFLRLLSASERQRYRRFVRRERQRQFLLGRILLRCAVSHATHRPLNEIDVIERPDRAPEVVVRGPKQFGFSFSLSHSRHWIGCAVALGCKIGVDVEFNDESRDIVEIARTIFNADDLRWLFCQPRDQIYSAFYRLWCAREAFYKRCAEMPAAVLPIMRSSVLYSESARHAGFTIAVCTDQPINLQQRIVTAERVLHAGETDREIPLIAHGDFQYYLL